MSYRVIDLMDVSQGALNYAFGINDQHPQGIQAQAWPPVPTQPQPLPLGQVVGVYEPTISEKAFRWDESGGLVNIGGLSPGVGSWAYAINDAGTAVGWWNGSSVNSQAFMWAEDLAITAIAPILSPDTLISNAYDISDSGLITGRARLTGSAARFRGFVLDSANSAVTWIDAGGATHCFPHAINKSGTVVGQFGGSTNLDAPLSFGANRSFMWSQGSGVQPLFEEGTGTALDINDAGVIVGAHLQRDEDLNSIPLGAYIRRTDGNVFYPAAGFGVPGEGVAANAINNQNEVVGHAHRPQHPDPYLYAWIYDRYLYSGNNPGLSTNTYEDLNSLIPTDSGWHLLQAYDINNAGQIVGHGLLHGQSKPFLLVPNFVRQNPFEKVAELGSTVLGGISRDGGGVVIKPGGGGPVPPWDPIRALLTSTTRDEAALLAVRAAIELTGDEALRQALKDALEKSRRK